MSNHARGPAARSAHNLHVWRGGDYLGLGPGAHGRLTLGGVRTATVAHRRIADYVAGVEAGAPWSDREDLTPADAAEERLLLALRTTEGAPADLLSALDLSLETAPVLDLIADGFLTLRRGRLIATERGRPVLDGVLKVLLT